MNKIDFGQLLSAAPDHYSPLGWIVLLPLLGPEKVKERLLKKAA